MFLFKGDRNYIQSSDIFNFIDKNYTYTHSDIRFHKFLKSQPKIRLVKKLKINHKANIIAKIRLKNTEKFLIFYETNVDINNNYSNDESFISKFVRFNNHSIKCKLKTTISFMDIIVLVTKLWHLRKIDKKKKWIVVRIILNKKIIEAINKNLFIKVVKVLNNKNTESEIFINNKHYGKIYYSGI